MAREKNKTKRVNSVSEFRKDIVSGDWILVASGRDKRPLTFKIKDNVRVSSPKKTCPFENPQKENEIPLLWYADPDVGASENIKDWFLQVVPNKYPFVTPHHICPKKEKVGPYREMDGVGFSEVVVTRDHERSIADMTPKESELVIRAYQERYLSIKNENCMKYVLIFHNHGPKAGASISHPHSQILALPIIPLDVKRSLRGSRDYLEKNGHCAHCAALDFEIRENVRIVYQNELFIVLCPFAPRVSFEVRIYPRKHESYFENISKKTLVFFADALRVSLKKLKNTLGDPDYNFFIHTAPIDGESASYYHWHAEILPRTSIWAGVELGTGMEVVAVSPEQSADMLCKC